MSLKYRNSQGTETPVAGLNGTSGELVPSVALKQSGTVNFSCGADSWTTVDVTFATPMPDTDYLVNTDSGETAYVHVQVATRKSTTGFTMIIWNRDAITNTGIIRWTAFKLMTDTVHEADAAHIAQNTANFAPAFSEVTSYAVGNYVTYNNVLYRCTTAHTAGVWVAGHFTQVTVGGDLGAIVPSNASASNKLVAQYTPRSEYSINNSSGNDTWYKVGRYIGGNRSSRLDLISDRVDGQTFESSIRISGAGTNANYVSWIGEDGCENSVNAVQIDSSYNLYIKLMSYSAVRIIAYGNFESFDYEALQSSPSGSNIPLQKLVTESDLDATVIKGKHYHGYINTETVTIDISKLNITQYCTFEVTIRALYAADGNVTNVKYIYNASTVATPVKAYTVYNARGFEPTITFANDGSKLTSITITANGQLNTIDVNVSF